MSLLLSAYEQNKMKKCLLQYSLQTRIRKLKLDELPVDTYFAKLVSKKI